ncbi:hypothetical protein DCO58_03240 [Helicobacter saguini]|uniref:Anthranilate synthase component I family protein n=1 Tax=Helicobacter saguini TaxID=1548018 RepID=A0A347VV14_9HELI|nr:anthranilate synthase component I family protein [Helicobacter saguini]MWV62615.1 hypothetical protein [Helicobacter saguini]MWV66713.1 hypothetical protein [Helicobacter saguini]MWV69063.1 hypothetical protein [Helicobacter saguini]MWV71383.1 hypothetical protein [Helicobacter saguini]TLD94015.1 anthranilate synthase component I family protein [Helicobacter saguini]
MVIYGKYIYKNPTKSLVAFDYNELCEIFNVIEKWRKDSKKSYKNYNFAKYLVGYLSYEAGVILQGYLHKEHSLFNIAKDLESKLKDSKMPLAYFRFFNKRVKFKYSKINNFINKKLDIIDSLDYQKYKIGFNKAKEFISQGDTYQVNFTQEITLESNKHINDFMLFNVLQGKQNTRFKAFVENKYIKVLSFSPELFFKLKGNKIKLQPMKGTANRASKESKKALKKDSKNRSENVMIVDLLRNDLSKIAKINTLKVTKLFKILSLPSLYQMVSNIKARLRKKCTLLDIFKALFPSGSITGAPKLETMKIIYDLENRHRGIYCGALGVVSRKNATFSIPIRTLFCNNGEKVFLYGVGSGIVWDSTLKDEFSELELKCKFLDSM